MIPRLNTEISAGEMAEEEALHRAGSGRFPRTVAYRRFRHSGYLLPEHGRHGGTAEFREALSRLTRGKSRWRTQAVGRAALATVFQNAYVPQANQRHHDVDAGGITCDTGSMDKILTPLKTLPEWLDAATHEFCDAAAGRLHTALARHAISEDLCASAVRICHAKFGRPARGDPAGIRSTDGENEKKICGVASWRGQFRWNAAATGVPPGTICAPGSLIEADFQHSLSG